MRWVRNLRNHYLTCMKSWWCPALPWILQAACHKERHVSQKAVSFIHDILTEVLTDWNEPSHFHFNEALFRPFERIMQLELCDEDVQDQVSVAWKSASPASQPAFPECRGRRRSVTFAYFIFPVILCGICDGGLSNLADETWLMISGTGVWA